LRILVTNDDGIDSQGIHILARELAGVADVFVCVPEDERSGASHSVTLGALVEYREIAGYDELRGYAVRGTPVDCVRVALETLDTPFDMIVSGINSGANVGINVHYSGTVAAALEAAFLGLSGLAVSISSRRPKNYETAARYAVETARWIQRCEERLVVNLNVPDLPAGEIKGVRVTRTASTEEETLVTADENSCREVDECEGAGIVLDSRALAAGYVSITPLHVDLTARDMLDLVKGWELDVIG